jgi:DNA-binding response OmpR family regulator
MTTQRAPKDSTGATAQPPRILVVDDEAHIRSSLSQALLLSGYQVEVAEDGEEVLDRLTADSYDLMLLDLHMPGVDGLTVMRRARAVRPELLVVILTGYADLPSAILAVQSEAVDYLRKPTGLGQIITAVGRALHARDDRVQQQRLLQTLAHAAEVLRGAPTTQPEPVASASLVRVGLVALDAAGRRVYLVDDDDVRPVVLTENETAVLAALMAQPDQVVSCRHLAYRTFGQELDQYAAESVIRPVIFRLRQKLETSPKQPRLIRTARGSGYFFAAG